MACKKPAVCLSELKHSIKINTKENVNRLYEQVDYKVEYTSYLKAMAKITNKPIPLYDGHNLNTTISHVFTIRYTTKQVNNGYAIIYRNRVFDIKEVRNINEDNRWLELHAVENKTLTQFS